MYVEGAIKNVEIAQELFPDWICLFYIGNGVPKRITEKLSTMNNVELVYVGESENALSMFWRFRVIQDKEVDVMVSRDVDSRLSIREKEAIDEWLESDSTFHIMRDHPYHDVPILGGMWGTKVNDEIRELFKTQTDILVPTLNSIPLDELNEKGYDQYFLWNMIYPKVVEDSIAHDAFFNQKYKNSVDFPSRRKYNGVCFIGQVFDENDNYGGECDHDLDVLRKAEILV